MSDSPIKVNYKTETTVNKKIEKTIPTEAGTVTVSNTTSYNKNEKNLSNTTKAVYGVGNKGVYTSVKSEEDKNTTSVGVQIEQKVGTKKEETKFGVSASINIETPKDKTK
ncbi:MAG: hypothetical protein LBV67_12035 [Streptococcaceae bacterium]|jgi:hypothetical protein|nr:hypothetical protein [Streptococcaceae bacterium]